MINKSSGSFPIFLRSHRPTPVLRFLIVENYKSLNTELRYFSINLPLNTWTWNGIARPDLNSLVGCNRIELKLTGVNRNLTNLGTILVPSQMFKKEFLETSGINEPLS
jgi:hypothetical protein